MESDNDLDFWTGASLFKNVDIMMSKDKVEEILNIFKENEIQFEIMIENVER